jgi:hypothetical protein
MRALTSTAPSHAHALRSCAWTSSGEAWKHRTGAYHSWTRAIAAARCLAVPVYQHPPQIICQSHRTRHRITRFAL